MSYVHNCILLVPLSNGSELPHIEVRKDQAFRQVDEHAGGYKAIEANVGMLATNHLSLHDVCTAVVAVAWREPENIQLVFSHQGWNTWRMFSWHEIATIAGHAEECPCSTCDPCEPAEALP